MNETASPLTNVSVQATPCRRTTLQLCSPVQREQTGLILDFRFLMPFIVKNHLQLLLQWEELMKFTILFKEVNFLKYIFIQVIKILTTRAKFL